MTPPAIVFLVLTCVLALGVLVLGVFLVIQTLKRRDAESHRLGLEAAERASIEANAVNTERTRILREMHDIIAHSLTIIVAQADGGTYITDDPAAAARAFATIADTGRTAVDETRRVLGMLRNDQDSPGLAPIPDETRLDRLVTKSREAGLDASFITLGQPRPLPAGLGLTLFRICQEALTNTMKHGGDGACVTVTENWTDTHLILTITNTAGRPRETNTTGLGQGLVSMKERAALVGADLAAGPYEDGFRVRLVLPYSQHSPLPLDEARPQ